MDTRESLLCEPDRPLSIEITDAGSEILRLRLLAKDAISMLLCPEAHSFFQREQVAQGFKQILDGDGLGSEGESDFSESEEENDDDEEYEPGECVKWSDWPDTEEDF